MLKHGGNLRQAAEQYGIPLTDWLDLSTGINPEGWPVPPVAAEHWHHLPQDNDGLEAAARQCYQAEHVLPVAGSQAAIQTLPLLRPAGNVGMLSLAYAEHEYNWSRLGHRVRHLRAEDIEASLPDLDVLLLVNPNNPTGEEFSPAQLLEWQQRLQARNGWLVVDEAFMDTTSEQSLSAYAHRPGLIVLRSLGKFYGLAGARCGFVLSERALLERLRELLGPWTLSGPTRQVAAKALTDINWQKQTATKLQAQAERLKQLLSCYSLQANGGTSLFQWLIHSQAGTIRDLLAQQGIWVRYFEQPASLRFGLPGTEQDWQRLDSALQLTMNELRQREHNDESMAI